MVKSNFSASVISGLTVVFNKAQIRIAPAFIIGLCGFSVDIKINKTCISFKHSTYYCNPKSAH